MAVFVFRRSGWRAVVLVALVVCVVMAFMSVCWWLWWYWWFFGRCLVVLRCFFCGPPELLRRISLCRGRSYQELSPRHCRYSILYRSSFDLRLALARRPRYSPRSDVLGRLFPRLPGGPRLPRGVVEDLRRNNVVSFVRSQLRRGIVGARVPRQSRFAVFIPCNARAGSGPVRPAP